MQMSRKPNSEKDSELLHCNGSWISNLTGSLSLMQKHQRVVSSQLSPEYLRLFGRLGEPWIPLKCHLADTSVSFPPGIPKGFFCKSVSVSRSHPVPHLPYCILQIIFSERPSWNHRTYISHLNICARKNPDEDLEFSEDDISTQGANKNYSINGLGTLD